MKGDKRRKEFAAWGRWLRRADGLAHRFCSEMEDDPFAYNETASVSVLAAAAARAGYLSIAEYGATKGWPDDRRFAVNGRCDLWLAADDEIWAFEFKQVHAFRTGIRGLSSALARAEVCARCLRKTEGRRVAGLIVSLYSLEQKGRASAMMKLERLKGDVDYMWRIAGAGPSAAGTYMMFKLVD